MSTASDLGPSCEHPLRLRATRRLSLEVSIGNVVIGGDRPVAVQSMTTTRTHDAAATAEQAALLARAGCDIVRVTVPSGADADALAEIRRRLRAAQLDIPLVADIHFTPKLALKVVEHVDKVRINPGNFADRKSLQGKPYDESEWSSDVERAYDRFAPLVDRTRELGVALRIGVNHGSLSDRMVYRYGDSPEGMVESALEYVRFAADRHHHQLVVSMKASNTQVMVCAYRLLVTRLDAELRAYPVHLGVTEAGGGDEGRMKSATGIATLLADGIGDTIRVSLTEDPLAEIPVARELVRLFAVAPVADAGAAPAAMASVSERRDPLAPRRRRAHRQPVGSLAWGGDEPPRVEIVLGARETAQLAELLAARPAVEMIDVELTDLDQIDSALNVLDGVPAQGRVRGVTLRPRLLARLDRDTLARLEARVDRFALWLTDGDDLDAVMSRVARRAPVLFIVDIGCESPERAEPHVVRFAKRLASADRERRCAVAVRAQDSGDRISSHRLLAAALDAAGCNAPIVLIDDPPPGEDPRLGCTGRLASLLIDGIGDAVRLAAHGEAATRAVLAHGILQAARRRLERAEFIACPSCGRT
ncbi:MAG: (E)-4-hydroxy-3-methylbut-2-enyl-diphosphate synthase, partial [Acidobacteriota bacterium]